MTVPPDIADKINGKILNIWWFPVDSKEKGISSFLLAISFFMNN